jgi:hypothetical protein
MTVIAAFPPSKKRAVTLVANIEPERIRRSDF